MVASSVSGSSIVGFVDRRRIGAVDGAPRRSTRGEFHRHRSRRRLRNRTGHGCVAAFDQEVAALEATAGSTVRKRLSTGEPPSGLRHPWRISFRK
jgi:hypothetical protein